MIQVQTALGYSPLLAGVAYLPYGAGILAGMWLSPRVWRRIGTRWALLLAFTEEDAGLGSALFTSVQQIGGAIGVAALTIMGYSGGFTASAVCVALGAVLIVVLLPSRSRGPQQPAGHGADGQGTPTAASP